MALIVCPECKNYISDKARTCPKCGISMTNDFQEPLKPIIRDAAFVSRMIKYGIYLFIFICLLEGVANCFSMFSK
jgi:hypothetical protein